jgi:hypothetical protein
VLDTRQQPKTVSTVFHALGAETVETVPDKYECLFTGLKPGVNERTLEVELVVIVVPQ